MTSGRGLVATALACALVLTSAPSAQAALGFYGVLSGSSDFHPPDAEGTALADYTSPFIGWSFWVEKRGVYTVSSQWATEVLDGRVLLYRGPLSVTDPLANLVAVSDYSGTGTSFEVHLEAGVIYYVALVFAREEEASLGDFTVTVEGPSQPLRSVCVPPDDDPFDNDLGEALKVPGPGGDFLCVSVEYRRPSGQLGLATTAPFRSENAGVFWFFDRRNWEVLVKVLDGCAVNGHYWVFYAATTNVEFDLFVDERQGDLGGGRHYHNAPGHNADAVTDTAAFPCSIPPPG